MMKETLLEHSILTELYCGTIKQMMCGKNTGIGGFTKKKLNKRFIPRNQLNAQKSSGSKRASCYCHPTCASQCGIGTNMFA